MTDEKFIQNVSDFRTRHNKLQVESVFKDQNILYFNFNFLEKT